MLKAGCFVEFERVEEEAEDQGVEVRDCSEEGWSRVEDQGEVSGGKEEGELGEGFGEVV